MSLNIDLNTQNNQLWMNGSFVNWKDAHVHVMTHGLHYASSVFEGISVYNSKPFKLNQHVTRLLVSSERLKLNIVYNHEDISSACLKLIDKMQLSNAYLRPLIWRGPESSHVASPLLKTNIMIAGWEVTRSEDKEPFNLNFSSWIKPHPSAVPCDCKMGGQYPMMTISKIEAKEKGYDDSILLDWRGYIAEATSSNIFFVKGNELVTPLADAFLNGITRQTVIEIANKLSIKVREEYINPEFLQNYQGCFLTGTAIEIREIASIEYNKQKFFYHKNAITQKIKNAYKIAVQK